MRFRVHDRRRARDSRSKAVTGRALDPSRESQSEAPSLYALPGHDFSRLRIHDASPVLQRAVDFSSEYKSKTDGGVYARSQTYEDYKKGLGETKAASQSGGHKLQGDLEKDELLAVFKGVAKDLKEGGVAESTITEYVASLNQAFRLMMLDTVETQASYIGNAYVESDQFRFLTETSGVVKDKEPYAKDPMKVKLDESWLNRAAKGEIENVHGYETGGTINTGDWHRSFIGRGPIQVTHRHNFVQIIAILENRYEELKRDKPDSEDLKFLREAIDKIKSNP